MSAENNLTDFLTGIADAIREKTGSQQPIPAQEFAQEIRSIEGGGNTDFSTLKLSGDLDYENLIASGFNAGRKYINTGFIFSAEEKSWEIQIKLKMPDNFGNSIFTLFSSERSLCSFPLLEYCNNYSGRGYKINFYTSTDGTNITFTLSANYVLEMGKEYWIRVVYHSGIYELYLSTDGINYEEISSGENDVIYQDTNSIPIFGTATNASGTHYFPFIGGEIDLKETYIAIDGEIVWGLNLKK